MKDYYLHKGEMSDMKKCKKQLLIFLSVFVLLISNITVVNANAITTTKVTKVSQVKQAKVKYRNLINRYEKKYGTAQTGYIEGVFYWKGLCFAKLLDFDGDGIQELILVYQTGSRKVSDIKYHVEMWSFNGKNAKRVASFVSWTGNNCPLFGFFSINKYRGKYYLRVCDINSDYYYGYKQNNTLGLVYKFEWKWNDSYIYGKWYYNGKPISQDKRDEYFCRLGKCKTEYSFYQIVKENTIRNEIKKVKRALN